MTTPSPSRSLIWKRHRNEGGTWCRRSGCEVAGQDFVEGAVNPYCPICGRPAKTTENEHDGGAT